MRLSRICRLARLATTLLVTVGPLGCAATNPLFCDQRTPCPSDSRLNFCDIDKAYPGTQLRNECIQRPGPAACNRANPCELELHCSDKSKGKCVECTKDKHCEGRDDGRLFCNPVESTCTGEEVITCSTDEDCGFGEARFQGILPDMSADQAF